MTTLTSFQPDKSLPALNIPTKIVKALPVLSNNGEKPKRTRRVNLKGKTVYVTIYTHSDDPDEPKVQCFQEKDDALDYVLSKIREIEGREDFEMEGDETQWEIGNFIHWEVNEQLIQ